MTCGGSPVEERCEDDEDEEPGQRHGDHEAAVAWVHGVSLGCPGQRIGIASVVQRVRWQGARVEGGPEPVERRQRSQRA
jgi:hypothetical protein